jgi:hypothetical protein
MPTIITYEKERLDNSSKGNERAVRNSKKSPKAYAEDIIYERFGEDKFLVVWMKEN